MKQREFLENGENKKSLRLFWFATGKEDDLIETSRGTVELFKTYGSDVTYKETEGGHTWFNWHDFLHEFALFLFYGNLRGRSQDQWIRWPGKNRCQNPKSPHRSSLPVSGFDHPGHPLGLHLDTFTKMEVIFMRFGSRRLNGFTLIELLIVVAIIGILAAIAVPNFLNAQLRARIAATEGNMKAIGTAVEMYGIDHGKYPNTYYPGTATFINPRVYRFQRLTTPVAYMSASVRDVFNKIDAEADAVYPFWGPDTMDHRRLGTWFDHPDLSPIKNQRGGWAIMSFGPDQDYESTQKQYLLVFAASNGLTSDGDIYRFGP